MEKCWALEKNQGSRQRNTIQTMANTAEPDSSPERESLDVRYTLDGTVGSDDFVDDDFDEEQTGRNGSSISNIPSLVCAFLASLTTGGTTYAFSIYGDDLKHSLGLHQSELDSISTAFFFAGLLSWAPGLISDKCGVRFAMATGGITGATATGTFWLVAKQIVRIPRFAIIPTLATLAVLMFISCALITGSVFRIIVSSCGPGTKGSAVGAAKGYVGLGAGVYSCLFESLRSPQQSTLDFLPMAGFFFLLCATTPALYLLPTHNDLKSVRIRDDATPRHFRTLYLSLIILAIIAVGDSMLQLYRENSQESSDNSGRNLFVAITIVGIWLGPIVSLMYMPLSDHRQVSTTESLESNGIVSQQNDVVESNVSRLNDQIEEESLLPSTNNVLHIDDSSSHDDDTNTNENEREGEGRDLNLLQMLQTPSALLMLWSTTILVGAGTVETNNLPQMVESLGLKPAVSKASTTFFSVAQAGARVMTGSFSEAALNWNVRGFFVEKGIPRPFFLVIASLLGAIAHAVLGMATHEVFFVLGSTMSGAAFGMVWPLMVLIVGEVFGTKNVGANYMFFDGFTSAAGTLLLSSFVAGDVYEDHIHADAPDPSTCYGADCFRATHLIVSALSLSCVVTSLMMMYTSRKVYNSNRIHTS